jgi:metal transporter CNNM
LRKYTCFISAELHTDKAFSFRLMGQDGVYLQVIATSGDGKEQKHAQRVYRLLKRGKHWVLVTLLLSNVIVNETLPIVLDRSLGGGWPAVLGSTVLIGKSGGKYF